MNAIDSYSPEQLEFPLRRSQFIEDFDIITVIEQALDESYMDGMAAEYPTYVSDFVIPIMESYNDWYAYE